MVAKRQASILVSNRDRALGRFLRHRMAVVGAAMLAAVALFVVIGSLMFSEADANRTDLRNIRQPPSRQHPFGTDSIGRSTLVRAVYGGQISIIIGIASVMVSITIGVAVGAVSGYYGGWVDAVLMRLVEVMLSIPTLFLLLVMARFFGGRAPELSLFGRSFSGSVVVIIVIIGATGWTGVARIVRAQFLSLKEQEFVAAARALGAPNLLIILRHILPNTVAPIVVAATLGVAGGILAEAYISFLGLGVQAPTASWGNMLNDAQNYITSAPWLWFFPGTLVVLVSLGINFLGDGLRDALDPRASQN
jgi:peptide/nickel transport system permease protein